MADSGGNAWMSVTRLRIVGWVEVNMGRDLRLNTFVEHGITVHYR